MNLTTEVPVQLWLFLVMLECTGVVFFYIGYKATELILRGWHS